MIILIFAGSGAKGVNYPGCWDADTFSSMTADGEPGPPRQRNARGTGERLRGELIEAAVRVLAARGDTERLSIRAVAAEAQVTPPAIYRCFPRPARPRAYGRGNLFRPFRDAPRPGRAGNGLPVRSAAPPLPRLRLIRGGPAAAVPGHVRRPVGRAQGAGHLRA